MTAVIKDDISQTIDEASMEIPKIFSLGKHWKTRIFSFIAFAGLASGCGYLGREGYFIATDGFAAPFILGPDNDLVVQSELKLAEVEMEKNRDISIKTSTESDIQACEKALTELSDMKLVAQKALTWTDTTTGQQVSIGNVDIDKLDEQQKTLSQMLDRQSVFMNDAKKNLEAGLLTQPDYEKEAQTYDQLRVAMVENNRSKLASQLLLSQAALGQQQIHSQAANQPMPQQVMAANILTTIETQTLQTQALMRTAVAEHDRSSKELLDISILEKQVMARPIFQATKANINAAFVPYAQSKGVIPGTPVMYCMWDLFSCKQVGKVESIVDGEAILLDPMSATQTRGIYVLLDVKDAEAMQSKILRFRP